MATQHACFFFFPLPRGVSVNVIRTVVGVLECARAGRPCSLAEMAIPAFAGVARRHATKQTCVGSFFCSFFAFFSSRSRAGPPYAFLSLRLLFIFQRVILRSFSFFFRVLVLADHQSVGTGREPGVPRRELGWCSWCSWAVDQNGCVHKHTRSPRARARQVL